MPAFPFVSIDADDDSVDFGRFKSVAVTKTVDRTPKAAASTTRTLILAPPAIAAHEEKLHALFASDYDRTACDLQMLDRLAAGFVPLVANTYDTILVLTDADGAQRDEAVSLLSSRPVFAALVPAMKNNARLTFQDGARLEGAGAREAILAGLVEKDGVFEKVEEEEVVVPLRLKKKTPAAAPKPAAVVAPVAPAPAAVNAQGKRPAVVLDLGEYSDGEELVDEDSLLTAEERSRPPQQRMSPRAPILLLLITANFLQPPHATLTARSAASHARTAPAAWPSVSRRKTRTAAPRPTRTSRTSSSSTPTTSTSSTLPSRARPAHATAAPSATPSAAPPALTLACRPLSRARRSRF